MQKRKREGGRERERERERDSPSGKLSSTIKGKIVMIHLSRI